MSLIRQTNSDPAAELRTFHRYILPLSTVLPGIVLLWTVGEGRAMAAYGLLLAGPGLALVGCVWPGLVRLLLRIAQIVSYGIGWSVSAVLILVLYFGVMMPVAWGLRLRRRKSPVSFGPDARLPTYWEPGPAPTDTESAFRQF